MCCDNCRPRDASGGCTCGAYMSILPPPACPVHGQAHTLTVTCSTAPLNGRQIHEALAKYGRLTGR